MEGVRMLGGRYRLIEQLGEGGMSVVWRAYDEVLGRSVAVKVLAPQHAADEASRSRIQAEAKAVALLSHPHIAAVYDYGESCDEDTCVPYVVMELVDGCTLSQRLLHAALPWRAALRICAEVSAAIAAAHARGLVHRDIKPSNVMISAAGVKVVDFGIAAIAGEAADSESGQLLGTPAYLAPERLIGAPVTPATDVYAVGLLLYRMLTRRLPWEAETTTKMLAAHFYADPAPLPPIEGLPAGVADLCRRCLAKDPRERPTSREVARLLAASAGLRAPVTWAADGLGFDHELDLLASMDTTDGQRGRLRRALAVLRGAPSEIDSETAILPRHPVPELTGERTRPVRRLTAPRAALTGVGLISACLLLATCADAYHSGSDELTAAAAGRGGAGGGSLAEAPCQVTYQTRSETAGVFDADVTVRNSGPQAAKGWYLTFPLTGGQQLRAGRGGDWQQSGDMLSVRDAATLEAGQSVTVGFTASYADQYSAPPWFQLNGATCTYQAAGVTATQPAAPVAAAMPAGGSGGGGAKGGRSGKGKGRRG